MLSVDQSNVRMLQRAEHERAEALMMSHRAIMQVTAAEGGPTNRCIVRWTLYIYKGNVGFLFCFFLFLFSNLE